MLGLIQILVDREVKPFAYAAAEAVTKPTKKALGRALWAAGFTLGALVLAIAAIGVGTVALTALALDMMPTAQIVLGWSSGALVVVAVVLALIGVAVAKAISPETLARESHHAFLNERHRQERAAGPGATARDPVSSSYAFARGFSDGLRH
jgi:hypothetical protein